MKFLFIGDIYGSSGIQSIKDHLTEIKEELNIDFTIANAENASLNGKGLNYNDYLTLKKLGINFFTLGNHAFRNKEIFNFIDKVNDVVRPYNWEGKDVPGQGYFTFSFKGKKIKIISLMGKNFMNEPATNPYIALEEILKEDLADINIVDFHAETTSEKNVLGFKFDEKLTAIFGTHTHVQTADLRINPNGCLYITDVGMTGPQYSSIGADLNSVAKKMIYGVPSWFKEANTAPQFNAIYFEVNEKTNKVINAKRIFINPSNPLKKI